MIARIVPLFQSLATRMFPSGQVGSIMKRSAGAGLWLGSRTIALSALRLLSNLIMARLVAPEAFGIVGIAITLHVVVEQLSDIGLRTAVVRSPRGADPTFLRTLWVTQIGRGSILGALVAGFGLLLLTDASLIPEGSIFDLPETPYVVMAYSLLILIQSFSSPSIFLADRNLEQKKISIVQIGTRLISIPTMVLAGLAGLGVWALVLGMIVSMAAQVLASHLFIDGPRMGFGFERSAFSEIFHFGKWLVLASGANIMLTQGDKLIFSGLFAAEDYSLYSIASIWVIATTALLMSAIETVGSSAVAETFRAEHGNVRGVYKRMRLLADLGATSAFLGLIVFAGPFIALAYPPDFEPAKAFVPLMALILFCQPIALLARVILVAGDSRTYSLIQVLNAVVIAVALPVVFYTFGAKAAVLVFALSGVVTAPLMAILARRHMKLDLLTEVRIYAIAAVATAWVLATQL